MDSTLAKLEVNSVRSMAWLEGIRAWERIALAYFSYLAVLGLFRPLPVWHKALLAALPVALYTLWSMETNASRAWSRVTREWSSLGLILGGYWSLEWFRSAPVREWQSAWVAWDRALLDSAGLRGALEAAGGGVPFVIESVYFLLYTIPAVSMGVLYWTGARRKTDRFLEVLFLGTFFAYAMLPLFPVASPRVAYPGLDMPAYASLPRTVNTWLLDHLDISTGVFPSGHVAVAFSSAFGLLRAARRRRIWMTAFLVAAMVYLATIYGRYHYAVDGLASIGIAMAAWLALRRWGGADE